MTILPGSTIGILGSGQLGRMLAMAARQMGYRVHVYSPEKGSPTGQIADVEFAAAYTDLPTLTQFAQGVDLITYEFENVPAATAHAAAAHAPLYPGPHVLHIAQNRLREKQFCQDHGLPVTPFAPVATAADLEAALARLGLPAILKTSTSGYDGKGQVLLRSLDEARELVGSGQWAVSSGQLAVGSGQLAVGSEQSLVSPFILEAFVNFTHEISVVGARGRDGAFAHFGAIENEHRNHILDISIAPARVPPAAAAAAVELTRRLMAVLDVVGVLCVEFFVTQGGRVLINEMAPRPHNSGHLTLDACVTSQFEQQLRAVCGLPLGDTRYHRPAAMANLLGDLWFPTSGAVGRPATAQHSLGSEPSEGLAKGADPLPKPSEGLVRGEDEPNWSTLLAIPGVKLHLYGKTQPRRGRKMGHITALAETGDAAAQVVKEARERLIS